MFDRADILAAVEANILSSDQAGRFEKWLSTRKAGGSAVNSDADAEGGGEALRFITNLNDIFITMGLGIFLFGSISLLAVFLSEALQVRPAIPALVIATYGAGASWLLAEYFCKQRRMLLPGMLLVIVFVLFSAVFGAGIVALVHGVEVPELNFGFVNTAKELGYLGLFAGLLANVAFFWRFRLPFCFAIFGALGLGLIYLVMFDNAPVSVVTLYFAALLGGGIACLVGAIWFDAKDPARIARTSDHAFWLHLVAAPQIIYGVKGFLGWAGYATDTVTGASLLMVVLASLTILALVLNRRALVVASLISLSAAVGTLLTSTNVGLEITIPLAATMVGGVVVLIGGGWHTARRGVRGILRLS